MEQQLSDTLNDRRLTNILINHEETVKKKDEKRDGKGGYTRYNVRMKPDHYEELISDGNLVTDRDRLNNKLNQKKGKILRHPTTGEIIERIIEIWKRLPPEYKYRGLDRL